MRAGCFVPLVAIVLIIGGGQQAYTGLANRKPKTVELADLVKSKPDAKWLNIKGGELDLINSTYTTGLAGGDAKSIHIPLVLPGEDSSESTIHVIVETKDSELLNVANQLNSKDKENISEVEAMKFLIDNRDKLRKSRPVLGVVKYGMESGKEEDKIKSMYSNLSPDVILIKEGERPDPIVGLFMLGAGIVILVFIIKSNLKKEDAPASPEVGTPPPLPPAAG